jgi:hypothetical protein
VAEEAVEIRALRRQGNSIREIARMLNLSRNTRRRYLRSEGLPHYQRERRPSKLDLPGLIFGLMTVAYVVLSLVWSDPLFDAVQPREGVPTGWDSLNRRQHLCGGFTRR